jgi:DivIVA domain-containing protein
VNNDDSAKSMANRIRNARFRTTRLSAGYDEREVDTYLDQATDAILNGRTPAPPARGFTISRLRPGYVRPDVDSLIAEITRYIPPVSGF